MIGVDGDGRTQAFLFGDGRLTGRDTSNPSWSVTIVGVDGNTVFLHYDLWPPESRPPDPPLGDAEVGLTWDGGDRFTPNRPFPSDDPTVDGHR